LTLIDNPDFYFAAVPAVVLTGISKGGFAGAFGGLALPLMALAISPVQAAGILLPILILTDLFGLTRFWRLADRRVLGTMVAGGGIGTLVGWATFRSFDEHFVRVIVGLIAVAFPLSRWLLPAASRAARPARLPGTAWSTVAGYTSFVAHAGGPPAMVYVMPLRLDKAVMAATSGTFFAFLNFIKLPPYVFLGQLSAVNLGTALVLAPLVPVGVKLGFVLQGRFTNEQFYLLGQTCIFLTGWKLLYDGLSFFGWF
jgi:uncharacterized membrane protein YfcA